MTDDEALAHLAQLSGVFPEFTDMAGVTHKTSPDTQRALLRANGHQIETNNDIRDQLKNHVEAAERAYISGDVVVPVGKANRISVSGAVDWQVLAEADGSIIAEGKASNVLALPSLPDGVHTLHLHGAHGAQELCLIAAPDHAPSVREATGMGRTWGVMAAFYGLQVAPGKTLADYDDLARFAAVFGAQGAGFLGINPVHALGEASQDTISPYSPTHRGFLNTDHIAVTHPKAGQIVSEIIDYGLHRKVHRAELMADYDTFRHSGDTDKKQAFEDYCAEGGDALHAFARFEVLSKRYGADSRLWPAETLNEKSVSPEELLYPMWAQWQADRQLENAQKTARSSGMALGLYLDLAVGARLGGAESWGLHSACATGVSLGAPPDQLSPAGQNWQLAALSPNRLRAGKYDAFRFVLRQNMRHCGLLRIDHALGLNRSFWLPDDGAPGGYIRMPFQELLAIIAIEAKRAGTVVVGEDLGLVPTGFRKEMQQRGLYGYSVLQYEKDNRGKFISAQKLRPQSLACFGTHDTPTLQGFWRGKDVEWWQKLGWIDRDEASTAMDRRNSEKRQLAKMPVPEPLPQRAGVGLRDSVHASLANSPAALVAVQLDDILGIEEAQNLPGTIDEHPNWRRRYPDELGEISAGSDLKKTAVIMAHADRAPQQTQKDIS